MMPQPQHPSSKPVVINRNTSSTCISTSSRDKMPSNEEDTPSMNRTSHTRGNQERQAAATTSSIINEDDMVDDEVNLHHSDKKRCYAPKRSSSNTSKHRDGGSIRLSSSPLTRSTNTTTDLKPPPHVQRTNQPIVPTSSSRVGGFDPRSLAWLQRMEEIATLWLNMLVQQQHVYQTYQDNLSKEKQRIVVFCTRTLQQILSEGGFRSYTTPLYPPSLYRLPLPPLQDLPCMVVTLKYWYSTLLSRCQHQTAVRMLPHRVLAPQQLSQISVPDYVGACEEEVKRWLSHVVDAETKSKDHSSSDTTVTSKGNSKHVAVWMQQLRSKAVPTYSPTKPKSTRTMTTQPSLRSSPDQPTKTKKKSRIPSPTEVMMFDTANDDATTMVNTDDHPEVDYEEVTTKPVAKKSVSSTLPNKSGISPPIGKRSTTISSEKAKRMRGLILSLYHANKCPFTNDDSMNDGGGGGRCCPVSDGCRSVKDLWQHITIDPHRTCCVQQTCTYSRLALLAEEALTHFGHCKKGSCPICGPVLVQMPKVKRDIVNAVKAAAQCDAVAVEEAILQVVDDMANEIKDHHHPAAESEEANDVCTDKKETFTVNEEEMVDRTDRSNPIVVTSSNVVLTNSGASSVDTEVVDNTTISAV